MAIVLWLQLVESNSLSGRVYEIVNLPGWWMVSGWLAVGFPRPGGDWGWSILVPWGFVIQWVTIGVFVGFVWDRMASNRTNTQRPPAGDDANRAAPGDAEKDINEHLKVLLDQLLPKRAAILGFAARGESYVDVVWKSTYLYAGTGPLIDAQYLKGITDLGAGIGFDIYQIDEDEDDANQQIHPIAGKPGSG